MADTKAVRDRTVQVCKDKNILLPTFEQLRNPALIPDKVKEVPRTPPPPALLPLRMCS